jgi:hypothetical protein
MPLKATTEAPSEPQAPLNAASADTSNTPLRWLIGGTTGAGKTQLLATLPGKKFLYNFDPNTMATLEGFDIDYEEFLVDVTDLDLSVKTLKTGVGDSSGTRRRIEPKTYIDWEADFDSRLESGFFKNYDYIAFDSLTMFLAIIMDRVLYLNGRLGKQPEQADWAAQVNTVSNVFRAVSGQNKGIFATAHIETKQNDLTKKIYNQFILTGQLRQRLPILFNNVLVAIADSDEKTISHLVQTRSDRENPIIRTSLRNLNFFEDVTIDDFSRPEAYGLSALLRKAGKLSAVG